MNCTLSVRRNTKPRMSARKEKGEKEWLQKQASGGLATPQLRMGVEEKSAQGVGVDCANPSKGIVG